MSWLCSVALDACKKHPTDLELGLASHCVYSFVQFQAMLEACPLYLTRNQADTLYNIAGVALESYKRNALMSIHKRRMLFPMRPKFHAFDHFRRDMCQELYSIRAYHCYSGEGLLKYVKKLCRNLHRFTMESRFLARYFYIFRYRQHSPLLEDDGSDGDDEDQIEDWK
eukprot:TRINITY_DN39885_c0_g1_i1.p1 TRINITY_DN39885_c0_g1~~TRINITY_DN39885_c0_g1_i1.p1  ORF type:complete len:177 (+),score=9.71 TRINITY_DN39885_c0_g1_i1:28-531(+)